MAILQLLLCCTTTLLIVSALELSKSATSGYAALPFDIDPVELADIAAEDEVAVTLSAPALTAEHDHHALPPPWLQFDEPPAPQQRISSGSAKAALIKLHPNSQQHKHGHSHGTSLHKTSGERERSCSIDVTTKIIGSCQEMGQLNRRACVSGEYLEIFSAECM